MKTGKKFEELIKLSASEQGFDFTRLRDAGYRGEQTERRFTVRNICDCVLFKSGKLFFIEIKHSKDRLTFARLTQHDDLLKKLSMGVDGVNCGYLLAVQGKYFYISVLDMGRLMQSIGKKSINANDLSSYEIGVILPKRKIKPRINLDELLGE